MSQINRADFVPCFLRLFTEKETCVMPGEIAREDGWGKTVREVGPGRWLGKTVREVGPGGWLGKTVREVAQVGGRE